MEVDGSPKRDLVEMIEDEEIHARWKGRMRE